jgi:hypothetical protein
MFAGTFAGSARHYRIAPANFHPRVGWQTAPARTKRCAQTELPPMAPVIRLSETKAMICSAEGTDTHDGAQQVAGQDDRA